MRVGLRPTRAAKPETLAPWFFACAVALEVWRRLRFTQLLARPPYASLAVCHS